MSRSYIVWEREEMRRFLDFCRENKLAESAQNAKLLWVDQYASRYAQGERNFDYRKDFGLDGIVEND